MPEYLENPRRVPRVPVRCRARLILAGGPIDTVTEDICSRGCRVVLSERVQRGDTVGLALNAPEFDATLRVDGRVAWVSPAPPWRVGISFAPQLLPDAARWFEALRQAVPGLFAGRRPQARLPVDAMIFLGPVPGAPAFREDELQLLRTVGAGIRVGELRSALSRTWPRMQRALFKLIAQGDVLLSRAAAAHPVRWKHILGEPLRADDLPATEEAADAFELLEDGPPASLQDATQPAPLSSRVTAKLPVVSAPPPVSRRIAEGIEPVEAPAPPRAPPSRPPPLPRKAPVPAPPAEAHAPDFSGAGVGWRAPSEPRSPEADDLLKLGLSEIEAHRMHGALALLRRALSLAPGDPDIAAAIGRAMRGG